VNGEEPGFRHLADRTIHRGARWDLVAGTFAGPDGETFEREIVRSPGAVGVVPLLDDGRGGYDVVLVAQYRPAHGRVLIEIPAGMRDVPGEPPDETARRELAEEVGLSPARVHRLGEMRVSAAMTDATTVLFAATGCVPVDRRPQGPEEERSQVVRAPLAEALAWIGDGTIDEAKSMLGLLLADRAIAAGKVIADP